MNKRRIPIYVAGLIIVLVLAIIGRFFYSNNNKKIEDLPINPVVEPITKNQAVDVPPLNVPTKVGTSTKLDISKALPKNLKIISRTNNTFMVEGTYSGIPYIVGVGTTLRPDGKCINEDYYYNTKTKVSATDWFSISPDDHKSGDFKRYNCSPEITLDGYVIPIISTEVQDLYDNTNGYMASNTVSITAVTIKNNFFNQIYIAQNSKYSLEELDRYGNALERIFPGCLTPEYIGKPLLKVGPNSEGCSPNYWQDSTQNTSTIGMDPDVIDYEIRKNFLNLVSNPGCKKDYVGSYLLDISSNPQLFKEDTFIKDLSCAGEVSISLAKPMFE